MLLSWMVHRLCVDRLGILKAFPSRKAGPRVLILTTSEKIAHAQAFPFFVDSVDGDAQPDIRELPIKKFLEGHNPYPVADLVLFQTWFDLSNNEMIDLACRIRAS